MSAFRKQNTLRLTQLSILTAIIVVLQCFGVVARLPFMAAEGNLSLIPIAIGAILLGPGAGLWLGLVSGAVTLIQGVMGISPFTYGLFVLNPFLTAVLCLAKTGLAGLLSAYVYRLLSRWNQYVALFTAAIAVPIVNTGVFVLGCLMMLDTLTEVVVKLEWIAPGDNTVSFLFLGLAGLNFVLELGLSLVLTPAVERIVTTVQKLTGTKKRAH